MILTLILANSLFKDTQGRKLSEVHLKKIKAQAKETQRAHYLEQRITASRAYQKSKSSHLAVLNSTILRLSLAYDWLRRWCVFSEPIKGKS